MESPLHQEARSEVESPEQQQQLDRVESGPSASPAAGASQAQGLQGAYNPAEYADLPVTEDVQVNACLDHTYLKTAGSSRSKQADHRSYHDDGVGAHMSCNMCGGL